jgi:hypothetical protein
LASTGAVFFANHSPVSSRQSRQSEQDGTSRVRAVATKSVVALVHERVVRIMARIAGDIAVEVLLALLLLAGLSAVHLVLSLAEGSQEFKHYFGTLHEFSVILVYTMIVLKGLIRIWKHRT